MKYLKIGIVVLVVLMTVLIIVDRTSNAEEKDNLLKSSEGRLKENLEESDDFSEDYEENKSSKNIKNLKKNFECANKPKVITNGLIPIVFDEQGNAKEVGKDDDWFNYSKDEKKWANAITKDNEGNITGYFVWIPRFAYKINYEDESNKSKGGNIDVKFLIDNTDEYVDDDGEWKKAVHSQTENEDSINSYIVHPSFTNGTENNFKNGEWDKEIDGFWVSKFPATFQSLSIDDKAATSKKIKQLKCSESLYTVDENDEFYTKVNKFGKMTNETKISYPTFLPSHYMYNKIWLGDAMQITREIGENNSFYNIKGMDSHIPKNSEYGAVAYLTKSEYGNIDDFKANNYISIEMENGRYSESKISGISQMTDMIGKIENIVCQEIEKMDRYNSEEGKKASSTGNIYGIYDLNGGENEFLTGFIKSEREEIDKYGNSNGKYNFFGQESTKYTTVYPYNPSKSTTTENAEVYKNSKEYYGDAMREMIGKYQTTWGRVSICYPSDESIFFKKEGDTMHGAYGVFYLTSTNGNFDGTTGFRACLINN